MIKSIYNFFSFHTDRKIVVFEVDDYGSIRMPSHVVYEFLAGKYKEVGKSRFNRFDSLSNEQDLQNLFDVLYSIRDKYGNPAVFSPLVIVTNPDFKKIKNSNYTHYYYETVPETLYHYFGNNNVWNLWQQGLKDGIFVPQFHGRDHLNVNRWMNALQKKHEITMNAFDNGFYALPKECSLSKHGYLVPYAYTNSKEKSNIIHRLKEGVDVFIKLFGYTPLLFTPPNGVFDPFMEIELRKIGIKFITRPKFRLVNRGNGTRIPLLGFMGRKNLTGMKYSVRSFSFEPTVLRSNNSIDLILSQINKSFSSKKPVVISSHRVNYVGSIDTINGYEGLEKLRDLLKGIIKKWPEVEFLSSTQLYNLILSNER